MAALAFIAAGAVVARRLKEWGKPIDTTVQPTPIYETLAMGLIAYLLWRLRDRFQPGIPFAIYLVLAGVERVLVEFIRRNDHVLLGLTIPQLTSIVMIIAGVLWLAVKARRGPLTRPGGEAPPAAAPAIS